MQGFSARVQEAGIHMDRLTGSMHTHVLSNAEQPGGLRGGRKPENLEETHTDTRISLNVGTAML